MLVSAVVAFILALPNPGCVRSNDADGIEWKTSTARGRPERGLLVNGVLLPAEGATHSTWDPARKASPSQNWRRWGTDHLIGITLCVIGDHHAAHPDAPRVIIGDISLPTGGPFGREYGGLGHISHQNGLDVDVYYPRPRWA